MGRNRELTTFSLVMMTVVSIDSIRNLPASALLGKQLVAIYLLSAVFFFIPAGIVSAHLSAMLPDSEGVYAWVKEAFGRSFGLLAVWLQWMSNVIWYPTLLSFVSATLAYVIYPDWAASPLYLTLSIALFFSVMTWFSCLGIEISAWFSTLSSICGLILPMVLIIVLGALWVYWGHPVHLSWQGGLLHWDGEWSHWFALSAVALSLCGIEITTVHAHDVQNPQKAFPKALFWATVIILSTLILGSITIAEIMPTQEISLVTGIMQMIERFLGAYHLESCSVFFAFLLVLGGAGGVLNWIIGPTRGLLYAFRPLTLPRLFTHQNSHGAPSGLLVAQAIVVIALSTVYLIFEEINQAYWVLTAVASQLYMLMYLIMFAACWKLRHRVNTMPDVFTIPGGLWGVAFICLIGFIGCGFIFCIGFLPPHEMHFQNTLHFSYGLLGLLAVFILPAYCINRFGSKA